MTETPELLLASRKCSECLISRRRIVTAKHANKLLLDCIRKGRHFRCHKGDLAGLIVHCRGVHDASPSIAYRFAVAMGIPVREVDPDAL